MEVHPPEHGIHSVRDFLVHMGTITLGLLIALGLEGLVEQQHHRHLVHTAQHNLAVELESNRTLLEHDQDLLRRSIALLNTDLRTMRTLPDKGGETYGLVASWSWDSLNDSAYDTARNTGAFAFMPYDEVQQIDGLYMQQHYIDSAADAYISEVNRIRQPLAGDRNLSELNPAERNQVIDHISGALVQIDYLQDLIASLHRSYAQTEPPMEGHLH